MLNVKGPLLVTTKPAELTMLALEAGYTAYRMVSTELMTEQRKIEIAITAAYEEWTGGTPMGPEDVPNLDGMMLEDVVAYMHSIGDQPVSPLSRNWSRQHG